MIAPQDLLVLFGLAGSVAALVPIPALAATGSRTITVTDQARRAVNELYVSPVGSGSWGDDRLGEATIEPGQTRRVRLSGVPACSVDVEVVYDDASHEERDGVDICRAQKLVFDGRAAVVPKAAQGGTHQVLLANASPRPIQQVLIAPVDAGDWGDDLLPDGSLSSGEHITLAYHGDCLADLRVVFDNRSAEERRNLDLCGLRGVVVRPGWTTTDALMPLPAPAAAPTGALATQVTISNHSGHVIQHLFIFPQGSAEHGRDLLAAQSLEDSREIGVTIDRPSGTCRFRAQIVYGGKSAERDLSDLDLCQNPTILAPPPP